MCIQHFAHIPGIDCPKFYLFFQMAKRKSNLWSVSDHISLDSDNENSKKAKWQRSQKKCFAPECNNEYRNNPNISFFRFPKDEKM